MFWRIVTLPCTCILSASAIASEAGSTEEAAGENSMELGSVQTADSAPMPNINAKAMSGCRRIKIDALEWNADVTNALRVSAAS